jgi:hypothetical protein
LQANATLDEKASMPWYKSRKLLLVMGAYGFVAFLWNFVEELTPMYASTPYKQASLLLLLLGVDCLALPGNRW